MMGNKTLFVPNVNTTGVKPLRNASVVTRNASVITYRWLVHRVYLYVPLFDKLSKISLLYLTGEIYKKTLNNKTR